MANDTFTIDDEDEKKPAPKTKKSGINKDGFAPGQELTHADILALRGKK